MESQFLMDHICNQMTHSDDLTDEDYLNLLDQATQLVEAIRGSASNDKVFKELEFMNAMSIAIHSQKKEHLPHPELWEGINSPSKLKHRENHYFSLQQAQDRSSK